MKTRIGRLITFEGIIRMVADTILVNLALLVALATRLLYIVAYGNPSANLNYQATLWEYIKAYSNNALILTIICLIIFTVSGFYTYGRFYSSRYKMLIVIQAVSLAYLVFTLVSFLSQGYFFNFIGPVIYLPRGVLVFSWLLTVAFLLSARAWSMVWRRIAHNEEMKLKDSGGQKIQLVLVIGGAGYIGSALLPKLLQKGYRVRILDMLLYGTDPIQQYLEHPDVEILQSDFRQVDKVVEAMRGVDAVIHLGGIVGDPACALDENLTVEINVMATRMIAEVAKGSGVRTFIFASTCSVYGASDQKLDEKSALNPVSLYARSKIASERVLLKMAADDFTPIILRFGTIYGLSGRTRFDLVVNLLSAKAVVEGEITIFGGDQWRPFLHVDDAALSIITALSAPLDLVRNQIYNVGSNEQNFTINQVGEMVQRQVPSAKIVHLGDGSDKRNYWVSFNKIRDNLGFQPAWQIDDGIKQVINAIQSGAVDDYRNAKYSNVKFLSEEGIYKLSKTEDGWAYHLIYDDDKSIPLPVKA